MNILFINKFLYPKGGTETYMMGLGAELSRRGHRVEYFGMEHRGNCVGNRVGAYTKDTDYHTANPVKKVSYALRTVYSTHARRQLRRVLEDLQPQVVHLNNFNYQIDPCGDLGKYAPGTKPPDDTPRSCTPPTTTNCCAPTTCSIGRTPWRTAPPAWAASTPLACNTDACTAHGLRACWALPRLPCTARPILTKRSTA